MTPLTMLLITFAAVAIFGLGWLLLVGLARAADDDRDIDEGQAFGGDYE